MLKGIPKGVSAEMLHAMMSMGHGDTLLICDINHPAAAIAKDTVWGRLVDCPGASIPETLQAILQLFPVDTFIPQPVKRMQVVDDPDRQLPIFDAVKRIVDQAEGRDVGMEALERFAFYAEARRSFVVFRTSDPGPYGCFILTLGVVNDAG